MTSSEEADGALAETTAGAVQGGGAQNATEVSGQGVPDAEQDEGEFDAGEFVVDHGEDPSEEVQPTTT